MLNTMVDVDKASEDKSPSPKLLSLVNEWADSYIKSTELPVKILEAAEAEGLNKQQIRKIVEDVLVKRGLSERRIREVLPPELKDQTKVRLKPFAAGSAAKPPLDIPSQIITPPADDKLPADEPEDEEPTPLELAEIKIKQLEDALKKTELFKPATELEKVETEYITNENKVFEWLRNRENRINIFYYDNYGIDLVPSRLIAQLKNSGVKVFRRLYFEV